MGATDSMCPKKRRILLRVLKAVAILRPRRFQGRKTPAAFSGRPARQPSIPSVAEGHLSERTSRRVRSDKGPDRAGFNKPARSVNVLLQLDLGALGLELGLEFLGVR